MNHSIKNQFLVEFKSLLYGYPGFVFSRNNEKKLDGIPVFVFHTIDPEFFESQLLFLKENGYDTLSINNFYKIITDPGRPAYSKKVLLTIDDARSSVWRYAYPLLKKYNMNATVFIMPGWTMESSAPRENLLDAWNGNSSLEEIDGIDPYDKSLCTWPEIAGMYNSGLINIESHTLFHREVFSGSKLAGFFTGNENSVPYKFKASPYLKISDAGKEIKAENYLGLPLFEASPLMLAGPKLNISGEFIARCREIYEDNKHREILWQNSIKELIADHVKSKSYFTFEEDSKKDALDDLKISRQLIQAKLDLNAGNHLCLPWTIGNHETINILKELGIKSCFWGVQLNKKINKPGDDPYFVSRIKNDFIFRLPGNRRKSIWAVYYLKVKRRVKKQQVY